MIIGIIFTSVGAFILALTLGLNLLLHEGALFMILPTSFCQGSSQYPLGMTIDILEYQGKYEYDLSSVRYEILPGEQELMDNKPVEPSLLHMISVLFSVSAFFVVILHIHCQFNAVHILSE